MAWHISKVLYEKWRSSQEQEVASLGESYSDGSASALLNGNPTPQAYLSPDRMKAFSRLSRFGMTCEPLTEDRGGDLLTWYLEGFPVRISVLPVEEKGSTEKGPACGKKWHGSLAKYDPDTCSWRTAQHLLTGGLEEFSATWPNSGTMRSGMCSALGMSAYRTGAPASFSWPTPTKWEGKYVTSQSPGDHYHGIGWKCWHEYQKRPTPEIYDELMSFPLGWTQLNALETHRFPKWCALHGIPSTPEYMVAESNQTTASTVYATMKTA